MKLMNCLMNGFVVLMIVLLLPFASANLLTGMVVDTVVNSCATLTPAEQQTIATLANSYATATDTQKVEIQQKIAETKTHIEERRVECLKNIQEIRTAQLTDTLTTDDSALTTSTSLVLPPVPDPSTAVVPPVDATVPILPPADTPPIQTTVVNPTASQTETGSVATSVATSTISATAVPVTITQPCRDYEYATTKLKYYVDLSKEDDENLRQRGLVRATIARQIGDLNRITHEFKKLCIAQATVDTSDTTQSSSSEDSESSTELQETSTPPVLSSQTRGVVSSATASRQQVSALPATSPLVNPCDQHEKTLAKLQYYSAFLENKDTMQLSEASTKNVKAVIEQLDKSAEKFKKECKAYRLTAVARPEVASSETQAVLSEYVTASSLDDSPRIAYWSGKVNQHFNLDTKQFETDGDGTSGANIDKLEYCKKYYPATVKVKPYKMELITDWKNAGNRDGFKLAVMTDLCIDKNTVLPPESYIASGGAGQVSSQQTQRPQTNSAEYNSAESRSQSDIDSDSVQQLTLERVQTTQENYDAKLDKMKTYYQNSFNDVMTSDGTTEQKIADLKVLKESINNAIKDLVRQQKQINAGQIADFGQKITVSKDQIHIGDVPLDSAEQQTINVSNDDIQADVSVSDQGVVIGSGTTTATSDIPVEISNNQILVEGVEVSATPTQVITTANAGAGATVTITKNAAGKPIYLVKEKKNVTQFLVFHKEKEMQTTTDLNGSIVEQDKPKWYEKVVD